MFKEPSTDGMPCLVIGNCLFFLLTQNLQRYVSFKVTASSD